MCFYLPSFLQIPYDDGGKVDDSYSGRRKLFLIMGYQHLFHIDIASFKTALTIG